MKKHINWIRISFFCFFSMCLSAMILSCEDDIAAPHNSSDFIGFDTVKAWDITTYAAFTEPKPLFFDSTGKQVNLIEFAKSVGVNTLRLRILNGNPSFPHASITQLLSLAKEAHRNKLAIWLDFHYSDVWADPGNQTVPKQWENLALPALISEVQSYTQTIVKQFTDQGTEPSIVQIGNEITPGMMWPLGKFNGTKDEASRVSSLFNAGANGARKTAPNAKIMLHIAGNANTLWWVADNYLTAGMNFDLWGISYYGNWHGCDAKSFMQTCENISNKNQKPFIIAETAYPSTLNWQDQTNNVFGLTNQLCSGFEASPEGQQSWLEFTWREAMKHKNFRGMGYWEPAWITKNGWSGAKEALGKICVFLISNTKHSRQHIFIGDKAITEVSTR